MSRRRYAGTHDPAELWRPSSSLSPSASTAFVTIARIFEQVDRAMLDEILADIERHIQPGEESTQPRKSISRLSDTKAHEDVGGYIEDIKTGISRVSIERDTLAYLTGLKCETAWSWVYTAVWEHQSTRDPLRWNQAKARSNEILHHAQAVLDIYDSDECQDLLEPGREDVGASIEAKLRTLLMFDSIFSRLTDHDHERGRTPVHHPFKLSFDAFILARKNQVKADRKEKYAITHQNVSKCSA